MEDPESSGAVKDSLSPLPTSLANLLRPVLPAARIVRTILSESAPLAGCFQPRDSSSGGGAGIPPVRGLFVMNKELVEAVLPRLAQPLYHQLERFRAGELDEAQFTRGFEALLQRQHRWLTKRGISDLDAALAIHSAVLVLSNPGLRAEAEESQLPLEVVEFRAAREAARDIARNYDMSEAQALRVISDLMAQYAE